MRRSRADGTVGLEVGRRSGRRRAEMGLGGWTPDACMRYGRCFDLFLGRD